ncbi:hypothetical protein [Streptomyces sp. RKND-216]|nr:hypothetical protein [Streptomyces sp. RKND-216]
MLRFRRPSGYRMLAPGDAVEKAAAVRAAEAAAAAARAGAYAGPTGEG